MADINIGAIAEQLNYKVDLDMHNSQKPYIVEQYNDDIGNGWEKWSNGKLTQHGVCIGNFNVASRFNLLHPFVSDSYIVIGNAFGSYPTPQNYEAVAWCGRNKTTTSFTGEGFRGTTANYTYYRLDWLAIGKWK